MDILGRYKPVSSCIIFSLFHLIYSSLIKYVSCLSSLPLAKNKDSFHVVDSLHPSNEETVFGFL